MKVIKLTEKHNCDHLLGKFLDHDSYDIVANESMDVYKPLRIGETYDEHSILLKFRKGCIPKNVWQSAYAGLRHGAMATDNRGLAAGGGEGRGAYQKIQTSGEKSSTRRSRRRWVTKKEKAVITYFAEGSPNSIFGDIADELYKTTSNAPLTDRGGKIGGPVTIKGGSIWIVKHAKDIDFDRWFAETKIKSTEERREAAIALAKKHISETFYGDSVFSGVGGYFDRYPRIPFCRETAWSASSPEKFNMALPMFHAANEIYKKVLPGRWKGQYEAGKELKGRRPDGGSDWLIGDSVYTTVTINKHFRTACHRDVGDLCDDGTQDNPKGFSNLTVTSNGKAFDGFYLCFPEYRIAVNIQPGDLIIMDAHQIHGNVPMITSEEGIERLSLVMYFREKMIKCDEKKLEDARRRFIYSCRDSNIREWNEFRAREAARAKSAAPGGEKDDREKPPELREGWNGISPKWDTSPEWVEYLRNNGFPEEAKKLVEKLRMNVGVV